MLGKGSIILHQLSLIIKLQPFLKGVSVKSDCLISKCIGNAGLGIIIISIPGGLKGGIIAGHCCHCIYIRRTSQINGCLASGNGGVQRLIGFLHLQLAALSLRNNSKLASLKRHICILRLNLVLCLCTLQFLYFTLKQTLIKSHILLGGIAPGLHESFYPFIWLLLLQKIQNFSVRHIAVIDLVSADGLRLLVSRSNLNGIILYIACNQLLCFVGSLIGTVDSVNIGSFKESVCIIVTHCSISASCCHRKNSCHNSRNFKSLMLLSGNRDDLLIQFLIGNRNIGNLRRTGRSGCRLWRRSGRFLRSLLLRLVRCYSTGRVFSSVLSAFIGTGRNNFHLKLFFRCFRFIC